MSQLKAAPGVPGKQPDLNFIVPFVQSAIKVLTTLANTKPEKEEVFVRTATQSSGDISAIIALNSNDYLGSMAITFEKACFLGLVGSMLGETYTEISPDIQDAAAEICNQVFGASKLILNQQGHSIQPAIPSVVVGQGHIIHHSAIGKVLAVRFKTEFGRFVIEAVVEQRGPKHV